MRHLSFVATAAVMGASFVAPNHGEAGNGWIHAGTSVKGDSLYVRPLSRNGDFVTYEEQLSGSKQKFIANCPTWQYKSFGSSKWKDVMPQSIGVAAHRTVYSTNVPSFNASY